MTTMTNEHRSEPDIENLKSRGELERPPTSAGVRSRGLQKPPETNRSPLRGPSATEFGDDNRPTRAHDIAYPVLLRNRRSEPRGHPEHAQVVPSANTSRSEVWHALDQLTREDLRDLGTFADRQLRRVGLATADAEDLVQSAVLAVATGERYRLKGRHPRTSDLAGHQQFLEYLRGVVRSLASGERCRLENRFNHATWDDALHAEVAADRLTARSGFDEDVGFRDLSELLFHSLSMRVPARLQPILLDWREQQFDCDSIPLKGSHRRLRGELRSLAAAAVHNLILDPVRSTRDDLTHAR